MRIPLDYYQILGVPSQVTDEQVERAHEDRRRQLPHQEYSERAIGERNDLLDEAYRALKDAGSRQEYEGRLLAGAGEEEARCSRSLESQGLAGALSILLELGEYERALRLGEECRDDESFAPVREDVLLTMALAHRELSRERWQDQEYERAGEHLAGALELLKTENRFPAVTREIDRDFYRLRPYRILEALSGDLADAGARSRGLTLLAGLLDDRGGIDGAGDDRSGLTIDDFLLFIQQLRVHLTLDEQGEIFEREARRPSPVGEYLLVYVSIARGFARQQPASIVRALEGLERLQKHQDVSLERAICALLLGRADLCLEILERSQERTALNHVRRRSTDPENLLPGLCHYGECWLRTEVCAHFQDLSTRWISLKDYFDEESVQNYLEELSKYPDKGEEAARVGPSPFPVESEVAIIAPAPEPHLAIDRGVSLMSETARSYPHPGRPERVRGGGSRKNSSLLRRRDPAGGASNPESERRGTLMVTAAYRQSPATPTRRQGHPQQRDLTRPGGSPRRRGRRRGKLRLERVALLMAGVAGMLAAMGFGVKAIVESGSPLSALGGEQLSIEIGTPVLEIPSLEVRATESVPATALSKDTAAEIVRSWLSAKAEAMGSAHQVARLNEILVDPALTTWKERALALKGNSFWKYDHQIEVRSVMFNPNDPARGTVEARVREKARYVVNGKEVTARSYDDILDIQYDLVRQGDRWLIQNTKIIKGF